MKIKHVAFAGFVSLQLLLASLAGLSLAQTKAEVAAVAVVDAGPVVDEEGAVGAVATDTDMGPTDVAVTGPPSTLPDAEKDPAGFFVDLYNGIRSGNWLVVGALILSGLTLLARKLLVPVVPWLKTDEEGVALVFGTSLVLGLANALWVKAPVDLKFLGAVFVTAVTAAGGYSAVKRVGSKLVVWLIGKIKS
jgi:hypothetical protein